MTPDRDYAEAAWNAAKNRAWALGLGKLVKPINLPALTPLAIQRATAALVERLDNLAPSPPAERRIGGAGQGGSDLSVTAANERRG